MDMDQRASASRVAMWCFLVMAIALWATTGFMAAILPLLACIISGAAARILWDAAIELESSDHPRF
ncbi:MAG: hypothetical protein ACM3SS_05525 [Rhodospirillaceae bacterium]